MAVDKFHKAQHWCGGKITANLKQLQLFLVKEGLRFNQIQNGHISIIMEMFQTTVTRLNSAMREKFQLKPQTLAYLGIFPCQSIGRPKNVQMFNKSHQDCVSEIEKTIHKSSK